MCFIHPRHCGNQATPPSTLKRSGFALIVALLLISFLVLLVVSLTTIVRFEHRSVKTESSKVEARQNAFLGLKIALGELQAAAGPDQRVSATADFLSTTDSSRENTTGIWASADDPSRGILQGDLIAWLASDAIEPSSGALNANYETTPASGRLIELVGDGSVDDGETNGIADDIVAIDTANTVILNDQGQTQGHYAWWIGDEGVKARINQEVRDTDGLTGSELKSELVFQANSFGLSQPAILASFSGIDCEDNADRLGSLQAIDHLAVPGAHQPYFHDLTAHSSGILTDVANGGFKRDLSLAFEMRDADFNASDFAAAGPAPINAAGFGDVQPIFQFTASEYPGNASFTGTAQGPAWHLLRDYYRLYHEMVTPMTNPTLDARVFSPNSNHATFPTPSNISATNYTNGALDQQPAALLSGGKAKNLYHAGDSGKLMTQNLAKSFTDQMDASVNILDLVMMPTDPIRLGEAGDPLRGGGMTLNGMTMPVMVTGNYMPYVNRWYAEYGIFARDFEPITVDGQNFEVFYPDIATRSSFVYHNPFNVTISHGEIVTEAWGAETTFHFFNLDGSTPQFYTKDGGVWTKGNISGNNLWNQALVSPHFTSARYTYLLAGSFQPGEMKTFNSNRHATGGTRTASAAEDNPSISTLIHPAWGVNDHMNSFHLRVPQTAAESFEVAAVGHELHPANVTTGYENDERFSHAFAYVATHLKQSGNVALTSLKGRNPLRDEWPMASMIDSRFVFPGRLNNGTGSTVSHHTRYFGAQAGDAFSDIDNSNILSMTQINAYRNGFSTDLERQQNAQLMSSFDLLVKPSEYNASDSRFPSFVATNPLAPVRDSKSFFPSPDFISNSVGFPDLSPDMDLIVNNNNTGSLFSLSNWGPSDGFSGGVNNIALIELPTSPVLSLGKLQHANLSTYAHMPALAVGNSLASPYIDPEDSYAVFQNPYNQDRLFYDLSYHLNVALWDSTFFSSLSIPYDATSDNFDAANDSVEDTFDAALDSADPTPLPNPRMKLVLGNDETIADVKAKLFNSGNPKPSTSPGISGDAGYHRVAENLMVHGAFNINSTSVEAWRSILSGARDLAIFESGSSSESGTTTAHTPFSRLSQPISGETDGQDSTTNEAWGGFRSFSDQEIETLANAIVSEIKTRRDALGLPFTSLAEFVNRELSSGASGRRGVLQAALDDAAINSGLSSTYDSISSSSLTNGNNGAFPHASNMLLADGSDPTANMTAPTYTLQGDILQAIGSFITPRSDTFRIRAYGESVDPDTGDTLSQMWLEAIVQRIPEPVLVNSGTSPSDAAYWDSFDSSGNPKELGRQFKIISIRELAESDV